MKKISFNRDWRFALENDIDGFNTFGFAKYSDSTGAAARFYDNSNWQKVDLPHDWALTLEKDQGANTFAGAYPNTHYHRFMSEHASKAKDIYNIGWYRKQFFFDPEWKGKRIWIEFEGIFRDAIVWVNGVYLDRHNSGYTSFAIDITDHLLDGENSVAVRVDSDQPEGWWYEGAGIYRNVNLMIGEPIYFKYCKTFVRSEIDGSVHVSSVLVNDTEAECERIVDFKVIDRDGNEVASAKSAVSLSPYSEASVESELKIASPKLWSTEEPYLYTLEAVMGGERTAETFGIRSIAFDADRGFLLNGKPLKIRGSCVHQDFGGVGVALSDNLHEYKIKKLKEMGVNAYRCAHHAPAPELLDVCDRLGMLVMDETREFGTSPEAVRQLTSLIERDRNHPCVFIWSLGNEEFSVQNVEWSYRLMQKATRIAKSLDPTRPVTYAGNNGSNFVGANGAAEVRGINYIRNDKSGSWIDEYHAAHPNQPIIDTEEGSFVLSRGSAVNDLGNGLIDSSGNVTMPWGSTPKGLVKFGEEREFFSGYFVWSGFDYRGEPIPFYYNDVVSSLGIMDLCGMEKPLFYYYKAWWTDEPVLKITPHWNHKPGDIVSISVFTNCDEVTLFLNGKKLETKKVERFDAPMFTVPFEAGVLSAVGSRKGETLTDSLVTSGKTERIECTSVLNSEKSEDTAIYQLDAYDDKGVFCALADDELEISAENGRIVGVGNGDPANWDPEQYPQKEKAKLIRSFDTDTGVYFVPEKAENTLPKRFDWLETEGKTEFYEDDLRIVAKYRNYSENQRKVTFTAKVSGVEGYEYIEFERFGCPSEIYLNGEKIGDNNRAGTGWYEMRPYRFYCGFSEGENEIKVVSNVGDLDAPAFSGYVKIGKNVSVPSRVKLHYGKARVFVNSDTPSDVKLNIKRVSL